MISRAEFCMVVAQAGLTLKIIQGDTYAIIVFMAVDSCSAPSQMGIPGRAGRYC